MRYLSVCSGIEAATAAWHPLGWTAAGFSEIEPFPSAVLAHHYPDVVNFGNFTNIEAQDVGPIDLLVGGTPCQSFSVAGLRGGLDDDRGNLALEFCRLADRTKPRWIVWENVPGVLSVDGGRAFGSILGALAELGYGFAYRVLDAQYVRVDGFERAVPQRRRRVFVVGYLGDWRRAAAVLFEPESVRGHPAPSREAGQKVAGTISARTKGGGELGTDFDCDGGLISNALQASDGRHAVRRDADNLVPAVARCLNAGAQGRIDGESETFVAQVSPTLRSGGNATGGDRPVGTDVDTVETLVAHTLKAHGFDASEDGTGRGTPLVPVAFNARQDCVSGPIPGALGSSSPQAQAVAYCIKGAAIGRKPENGPQRGDARDDNASYTLTTNETHAVAYDVADAWAVRRLMPVECERLQGFPDGFTDVPYRKKPTPADGPRYKALGNSMAVNVMRWIGQRIALCDSIAVPTASPANQPKPNGANQMKPESMEQFFTSMANAQQHQAAASEALARAFLAMYGGELQTSAASVLVLDKAAIRAAESAMVAETKAAKPAKPAKPTPAPEPAAPVAAAPVAEVAKPTPVAVAEVAKPTPVAVAEVAKPTPVAVAPTLEPVAEAAPAAALSIEDARKPLMAVQSAYSVGGDLKLGRAKCMEILKANADGEIALPKIDAKYYPAIIEACRVALEQVPA